LPGSQIRLGGALYGMVDGQYQLLMEWQVVEGGEFDD